MLLESAHTGGPVRALGSGLYFSWKTEDAAYLFIKLVKIQGQIVLSGSSDSHNLCFGLVHPAPLTPAYTFTCSPLRFYTLLAVAADTLQSSQYAGL